MYLIIPNTETREALPSLKRTVTHEIFCVLEVKGEATEASVSDKLMPQFEAFRAPTSLAPSPFDHKIYE